MKKDISTKELASLIGTSLETAGIEAVFLFIHQINISRMI